VLCLHDHHEAVRNRTASQIVEGLADAPARAAGAAWQPAVHATSGLPRRHAIEVIRRLLPLAARLSPADCTIRQPEAAEAVMRRLP